MKLLTLHLTFLLLTGCGISVKKIPAVRHPQKGEIQSALKQAANASKDPFIIVETVTDRNFIQFWVENGIIEYDLPQGDLSDAKFGELVTFHNAIGISEVLTINKDPVTLEEFEMVTLKKQFQASQIEEAANLAVYVLTYGFGATEQTTFNIIRGWKPSTL